MSSSFFRRRFAALAFAGAIVLACGGDEPTTAARSPAGVETRAVAVALPAGARIVVSGHDLRSFWTRLQGTRLYTELTAVQELGEMAEARRDVQRELCVELSEATILTLLGEKFDLGFYGQRADDEPDLLLVARIEDEQRARRIVEQCEQQLAAEKGATFREEEYAGETIRVGTSQEGEEVLFYALDDERLTIATTRNRLQQAIGLEGEDVEERMTGVDGYVDLLKELPDATVVVYVDQEALRQAARVAADTTAVADTTAGPPRRERLSAATAALGDFRFADAVAVGIHWADSGIRGDAISRFPEGQRNDLTRMLAESPSAVRSLGFQPVGTMLYGAITTLDARVLYDQLYSFAVEATREQMDGTAADSARADSIVAARLARFEQRTGIDVEDEIVSWIGEEVAFAITGVDKTGFFPVPQVALTVEAADRQKAQAFLTKAEGLVSDAARAQASIPLQWQAEEYEGQTIRYAPTPMGQGLALAYTVGNDFALVASSSGLVKRMLDARAGRAEALPANPEFGTMTEFYPQRVNGLGYVDIESILTEVEGLMGTLKQMTGDRQAPADTASTGRRLIAALKNAPRFGFYSEASDAGVAGHFLLEVR